VNYHSENHINDSNDGDNDYCDNNNLCQSINKSPVEVDFVMNKNIVRLWKVKNLPDIPLQEQTDIEVNKFLKKIEPYRLSRKDKVCWRPKTKNFVERWYCTGYKHIKCGYTLKISTNQETNITTYKVINYHNHSIDEIRKKKILRKDKNIETNDKAKTLALTDEPAHDVPKTIDTIKRESSCERSIIIL
jgi:hypothetical protein